MATNRVKLEDVINEAKTTLERGDADRAIALCNHVFQYYPRCLEASRVLGEAYTEKRLLDEADQLFVFVLSADPQDVLGYVDRGFIAYERGEAEEAILYYERGIEIDPSIPQLREELLRFYRENPREGRNRIRTTKVGLANRRLQDGFYGQAIEEYNAVLSQTPNRLDVQVSLLEAYWRNRDARAEKLATELLETHPDLIKANLILWHIYGVRRNQDRAAPYLEKAHALDPLNVIAERLFDDRVTSNDAMNYIEMLGVPAIPAFSGDSQAGANLVPDWATAHSGDTDVELGLRPGVPSPLADTPSNLGFDVFALLADTERYVADQKEEATKTERDEALAGLDELRSEASEDSGDVFNLFDEVEPAKIDLNATRTTTGGGAFDLDFGEESAFEGAEPAQISDPAQADQPLAEPFRLDLDESAEGGAVEPFHFDLENSATTPAEPFQFELPDESTSDESGAVTPFNLEQTESSPRETKTTNDLFDMFADDEPDFMAQVAASAHQESRPPGADALPDEASGPIEPFEPALEPVPPLDEAEPVPDESHDEGQSDTAGLEERPAFLNEPVEAAAPQAAADNDDAYLNFLLEENAPLAASLNQPASVSEAEPFQVQLESFQAETPQGEAENQLESFQPEPVEALTETETEQESEVAAGQPLAVQNSAEEAPAQTEETEEWEDEGATEAVQSPVVSVPSIRPVFDPDESGAVEARASVAEASEAEPTEAVASQETDHSFHKRDERGAAQANEHAFHKRDERGTAPADYHVFHKRNEQGQVPDFVWASAQTPLSDQQTSADSFQPADSVAAQANSSVATGSSEPSDLPTQPQPYQQQENDAMPIKRGPEDDNDVFDWEREELPDYLQAFAMDEDEIARSGLAAPNPAISDVNTPPARIRPRDDTGAPGDLPDWLNPVSTPSSPMPSTFGRGEQIDLGGTTRPGSGTLPNWLDSTDLDASSKAPPAPTFGAQQELMGLEPFSLTDDDGFGGPASAVTPPPASSSRPATPPPPLPTFGDMDDIAPFSLDDNAGGFEAMPTPPPAPPAGRSSSPFGGSGAFEAPARPAAPPPGGGAFDDDFGMEGLVPFSLDEGEGMPLATPPAQPPSRQTPPPAAPARPTPPGRDYQPPMPAPSFMPPDDMGDLIPFSLDDDSPATPPPARQTPPPPAAPPSRPAPAPQPFNPFEPGADTSGFESFEAGGDFSPFRAAQNQNPAPPAISGRSSGGAATPAPSPFGGEGMDDFDIAPFSLDEELPGIFPSANDPRDRGDRGLGLGAMNPFDTLDDQPYREPRSRRSTEPTPEVAPGEEAPLIGSSLRNRIKQTNSTPEAAEEKGQTLFEKLKQRRQQQDEERAAFSPPVQPTPKTGTGELGDLASFEEIERRANRPVTAPLSTPPVQAQPTPTPAPSAVTPDMQAEAFDLSTLGLNQDLDDEAFNLSLDETLPSSPAPATPAQASEPQSFDFEPFDLSNIAEEAPSAAEVPPQQQSDNGPLHAFGEPSAPAFDFGEPAQAVPSESDGISPFDEFDFTEPRPVDDALTLPAEFDFGAAQPVPTQQTPLDVRPQTAPLSSSAGAFSFEQPAQTEPTPPVNQTAAQPVQRPVEPPIPVTPIQQPMSQQPTPPPTTVTPTSNGNGNGSTNTALTRSGGTDNLQLADDYFAQQDYGQAITYFNSAIKTADPESLKGIVSRLKQITASPDAPARFHRVLGDAYKKQGLFQAALAEYSKALGPAVAARK